jgi:hypothetical protein
MMTPDEYVHVQQERIAALEIALRGCMQQMQAVDMGRKNAEQWAMAYALAEQALRRSDVIY